MIRYVAYVRVSTDEQAQKGTSPEVQREACEAEVRRLNGSLVATCQDLGVSGSRYRTRRGVQEAVGYIERGEAQVLIAARLDRVARSTKALLDIAERVDRAGGRLRTCDGMEFGGTPVGRMVLTVLAAIAELERGIIRERSMTGLAKKADKGKQPTGNRAFGYIVIRRSDAASGRYPMERVGEHELHPEEAPYAREMFERYAAGTSLNGLCAWLYQNGVKTTRGNSIWRPKAVRQILMNPLYKGTAAFGKTELRQRETDGEVRWTTKHMPEEDWKTWAVPAIVPGPLWDAVNERLSRAREEFSGRNDRKYLLSGLVRCPSCGYGMTCTLRKDTKTGNHYPYLFCQRARRGKSVGGPLCEYTSLHGATRMEQLVLHAVTEFATKPEMLAGAVEAYRRHYTEARDTEDPNKVEDQLRRLETRERAVLGLQIDAAENGLDVGLYTAKLKEIAGEREQLRDRMRALEWKEQNGNSRAIEDAQELMRDAALKLSRVLHSDQVPVSKKRDLLAAVVQGIIPAKAAIEICLRALWAGKNAETVPLTSEKSLA